MQMNGCPHGRHTTAGDPHQIPVRRIVLIHLEGSRNRAALLTQASEVGTQGVLCEVLLPETGRQERDLEGGRDIDTLQHIDEGDRGIDLPLLNRTRPCARLVVPLSLPRLCLYLSSLGSVGRLMQTIPERMANAAYHHLCRI